MIFIIIFFFAVKLNLNTFVRLFTQKSSSCSHNISNFFFFFLFFSQQSFDIILFREFFVQISFHFCHFLTFDKMHINCCMFLKCAIFFNYFIFSTSAAIQHIAFKFLMRTDPSIKKYKINLKYIFFYL